MIKKRPYFMNEEEWYYYDYGEERYKLTSKATEEAKKSYNEYYGNINEEDNE